MNSNQSFGSQGEVFGDRVIATAILRLWAEGFPKKARLDASLDLDGLARNYELSGGAIMNVIRQVSLAAIAEGAGDRDRRYSAGDSAGAGKRGTVFGERFVA